MIRQSAFKGLREDRPPEEIVLEVAPEQARAGRATATPFRDRLTHPERILWPEPGVTKEGLAEFYTDIADWILPHIAGRVLSLVRCPSGVGREVLLRQARLAGLSDAVRRVDVGEKEKMLILDNLDGLIDLVQAGVLEIHPWGSTLRAAGAAGPADLRSRSRRGRAVERGDRRRRSRCASRLAALGLESFVKTSGGKGLHVVLPIEPEVGWDDGQGIHPVDRRSDGQGAARALRRQDEQDRPARAHLRRLSAQRPRRHRGRALLDPGAAARSVSTPLAWDELSEGIRADHFKIDNLRQRLDVLKDDPWPDFFTIRQRLPK